MKKRKVLLSVIVLSALLGGLLISCGQKEDHPSVEEKKKELLIEAPSKASLEIGESITLSLKTSNLEEGDIVNWYSSDTSILSVTQNGKVIALKAGMADIYAKTGDVESNKVSLIVNEKKVIKVTLSEPSKNEIEVDEVIELDVKVDNADLKDVTFTLSDPSLGSIDNEFNFKALKEGTCVIFAKVGETKSNEITIKILKKSTELSLNVDCSNQVVLLIGNELTIKATVKGNVNNYPVIFKSLDENVCSFSSKGLVKALKEGTTSVEVSVGHIKKVIEIIVLKEYAKATSVSYETKEIDVAVGEKFEIKNVEILPNTAKQEFTLESSNEVYASTEGHLVVGKKITTDPITVSIKADGALFALKVNVIKAQEKYGAYLTEKLGQSKEQELVKANSGELTVKTLDNTGKETQSDNYKFTSYNDDRTLTTITKTRNSSYSGTTTTVENYEIAKFDNKQIRGISKYGEPDVLTYSSYEVNESDNTLNSSTINDASKMGYFGNYTYFGMSNYIAKSFFSASSLESKNVKDGSYIFSEVDNTVKVDATIEQSYGDTYKYSLTMNFEDSLINSFNATVSRYTSDDYDNDNPSSYVLKDQKVYEGTLNVGEKQAPTSEMKKYESFYATSFDVVTKAYRDRKYVETNEFYVGESVNIELTNVLPATFEKNVDKMSVEILNNEDAVRKTTYGFSFIKPVDELKILVKTKNVSKEVTLKASYPKATTLSYTGSEYLLAGDAYTSKVSYSSSSAVVDFEATLSNNTSNATIDMKADGNFTINASQAGSVDVLFKEKKSGLTISKKFYSFANTDDGILDMIFGSTISVEKGYTSAVSNLVFIKDDGAKSGKISYSYCDNDYEETYNISDTWTFENKKFVIKSGSTDNYTMSIDFATSVSKHYDLLAVKVSCGYDNATFRLRLTHK